ncbi:putative polyvalent protein kinase domain-containing protein [Mucilaginibacter myungsuensis]|uniref:Uncharacterized protein n=1 Tax=Mucilaginibacter myungsuensis TaxID=649104 RepID=A0A929L2T4_9SPHI|nr:hypothetical protein [Mucilaginibacter myungsuensis]MBE9663419.1 hypothetical protein [Mucilaginibacter myungsuensis]MDN3600155.1 hypothetical protein [Mucilaginibacter myungsuensis]
MKDVKYELQNIIFRDEQAGAASQLKQTQNFLRRHAKTSVDAKEQQQLKSKEAEVILAFAQQHGLIYEPPILEVDFIGEGAEQRVYKLNDTQVVKTNGGIFYESWLDYFNSLLIHNYFFPATAYSFLGFKLIIGELHSVIKQEFIITSEETDLNYVKEFLLYNGFENVRNNDYINRELGLILEDLHDENVLSNNGILFFIDTVFFLTDKFYSGK